MGGTILNSISMLGVGFTSYIIPFLFVLTIVVFFHELGHFLVARWCGIKVLVFSVGFGPELIGFNDRHGTRWKLSAIPLGGYVKFFGDENAASVPDTEALSTMAPDERKVSFFHKPVAARAAVVFAGPLANFILAVVIFAGVFALYGKQTTSARIDAVTADSAAAAAGFKPGDLVLAIDGRKISDFADMQRLISVSAGKTLEVVVDRGGVQTTLKATPALQERKDNFGNVHRLGVLGISRSMAPEDLKTETVDPLSALWMGVDKTWFVVDQTLSYLGKVVVGRESADQLGGPGRIAQVAGQVWNVGFTAGGLGAGLAAILDLAAVLSVSIGLLNLFPVPLLDGGHLLFYAIEAVRGRPLSDRAQEVGFRIGFAIVVMLMVFACFNDIVHFARS